MASWFWPSPGCHCWWCERSQLERTAADRRRCPRYGCPSCVSTGSHSNRGTGLSDLLLRLNRPDNHPKINMITPYDGPDLSQNRLKIESRHEDNLMRHQRPQSWLHDKLLVLGDRAEIGSLSLTSIVQNLTIKNQYMHDFLGFELCRIPYFQSTFNFLPRLIWGRVQWDKRPKGILNSNLAKSRLPITYFAVCPIVLNCVIYLKWVQSPWKSLVSGPRPKKHMKHR